MRDETMIVRERQLAMRRELDRRGIHLKAISFDSGIAYSTLLSYFPGEQNKEPHTISGAAISALCGAIPADILSLLLPTGFAVVAVPEELDHDTLAELARDFLSTKDKAHHPDSEAGRDIGPREHSHLASKAIRLAVAA